MSMNLAKEAALFAIQKHDIDANQKYNGHPYSLHLSMVADEAAAHIDLVPSFIRPCIVPAAWLHDCIEDARVTYSTIKEKFGLAIAEIVFALTNEKGRTRKDRANEAYYEGLRKTTGATLIKMCDRIANVRFSVENNSPQIEMYRKENAEFLRMIDLSDKHPLVIRLKSLLYP